MFKSEDDPSLMDVRAVMGSLSQVTLAILLVCSYFASIVTLSPFKWGMFTLSIKDFFLQPNVAAKTAKWQTRSGLNIPNVCVHEQVFFTAQP